MFIVAYASAYMYCPLLNDPFKGFSGRLDLSPGPGPSPRRRRPGVPAAVARCHLHGLLGWRRPGYLGIGAREAKGRIGAA